MIAYVKTERLRLRPWSPEDRSGLRALCADSRVMEFFPAPLSARESDTLFETLAAHVQERGWGVWALDITTEGGFSGFVGLKETVLPPGVGGVEVSWRLRPECWGKGYATEAARAAMDFGFRELRLPEIVAFTALPNLRSQAVMQRLGMGADGEFDHPALPDGHRLRRHVLYRKKAP